MIPVKAIAQVAVHVKGLVAKFGIFDCLRLRVVILYEGFAVLIEQYRLFILKRIGEGLWCVVI